MTKFSTSGFLFTSNALKLYCQERSIKIRYVVSYMYKENGMAERCWRTLAIMKDALLINSGFLVNFWAEAIDTSNYLQNRLSTKCSKCIVIP